MKKIASYLAGGLLLILFCPGSALTTELTLLMPSHEADIVGFFEQKTAEFEKKTGTKVNIVSATWEEVADKVMAALAAESPTYDVIEFDNSWVAQFAETNWVIPLEKYAGKKFIEGMLPGLVDLFSAKGHLYGVTWNYDARFFMYNARILRDAGIEKPPATWYELIEQSRKLQSAGLVEYGLMEFLQAEQDVANLQTVYTHSFGGKLVDEEGKPILDSPQCIAALHFMVDLLQYYKVMSPASLTVLQKEAQDVFLRGDTAYFPQSWPGIYGYSRNPETSKVVGEIEVAPKPLGLTANMGAALSLPEALAIPTIGRHPDEAWALIKFLTNKETNKAQSLAIGSLPIWTELYQDPELLKLYPHWKEYGKQGQYLHGLPKLTWYSDFAHICAVEVVKALTLQKTVEEATSDMMEQLRAVEK